MPQLSHAPVPLDGDGDVDAAAPFGAAQTAIGIAAAMPEMLALGATAQVITCTFQPNGDVLVDVDGTSTTVVASEIDPGDLLGGGAASSGAASPPASGSNSPVKGPPVQG